MTTPQHEVADAIRQVTSAAQTAFEEGYRAGQIDLHDLTELLLSIADRLDPPFSRKQPGCAFCQESGNRPQQKFTCPYCGQVWHRK